jgi:hypothetical protein
VIVGLAPGLIYKLRSSYNSSKKQFTEPTANEFHKTNSFLDVCGSLRLMTEKVLMFTKMLQGTIQSP